MQQLDEQRDGMGSAQLGHADKQGGGNSSWNSSHPSRGCSQPNLVVHRRRGSALLLRGELRAG